MDDIATLAVPCLLRHVRSCLRLVCFAGLRVGWEPAKCLGMMNSTELPSVPSDRLVPVTDQLRLATAAYLA